MNQPNIVRITFEVPEKVRDQIKDYLKTDDRTMKWLMLKLISKWLKQRKG